MYLTEILTRCSRIEARMARLYRTLGNRFADAGEIVRLWREFALEDETHADVLRREQLNLDQDGDAGPFLPEYQARLDEADRLLDDFETRVHAAHTADEARALSPALQQSTLEDLYDDLVLQGPPAFKLVCERLEAALANQPAATVPGVPQRRRRERSQVRPAP